MRTARRDYEESRRGDILLDEVRRWGEANDVRSYCEALSRVADADAAHAWIGWARGYAERIDPLRQPGHGVPDVAEPSPGELARYLVGFGPYGPTS
jgi:hypothetical protein